MIFCILRFNSANVTERKAMVLEKMKDAMDIPTSAEKMMEISGDFIINCVISWTLVYIYIYVYINGPVIHT